MSQPGLFDSPPLPQVEGFAYRDGFLAEREAASLAALLAPLPFRPFEFGPYTGKRQVVSFGWRYDYGDRTLKAAAPLPDFLVSLKTRAEAFAGAPMHQALVTRYDPGVSIGWHRDRPHFAEVVGISLLSAATLRFRRRQGAAWSRASITAEPGSVYLLAGEARRVWEHSIPPVPALRYSVTFRRLVQAAGTEAM